MVHNTFASLYSREKFQYQKPKCQTRGPFVTWSLMEIFVISPFREIVFTCSPLISGQIPLLSLSVSPPLVSTFPYFPMSKHWPRHIHCQCSSIILCQHFPDAVQNQKKSFCHYVFELLSNSVTSLMKWFWNYIPLIRVFSWKWENINQDLVAG